jgi:2',3'-cyclic-nucleotide 2'-phosphodiesterase (5'-nucleotidase family)
MDISEFPWLGSNIRYSSNGELFHTVLDTDIFEIPTGECDSTISSTIRVGVFGVCTQATPNLAGCSGKAKFENVVHHSSRCTQYLKNEQSCDVVIALTHVSLAIDKDIAESVPGIDVIIGGHDHDPFLLIHRKYASYLFISCS